MGGSRKLPVGLSLSSTALQGKVATRGFRKTLLIILAKLDKFSTDKQIFVSGANSYCLLVRLTYVLNFDISDIY